MPEGPPQDATLLLTAAAAGDAQAAESLLPLVYDQLRRAAQNQLAGESHAGDGHTLSATVLVHEAYLKLVGPRDVPWAGQAHFYAAAAEAMRRLLIDHARARKRLKRGGGRRPLDITSLADLASADPTAILRFDEAFRRLEEVSEDAAGVARLRLFAGLSVDQTAAALGVSSATVDRRWAIARAWLFDRFREPGDRG